MWTFGRYDLGLTEIDFWELTPGQLDLLAKRHNSVESARNERADYRSALICSVIANVNRGKGQKPFKVQDFMPQESGPKKNQTPEEQLTIVKMLNAAFGGEVI